MEYKEEKTYPLILKPADWFPKLVSLQADLIYDCIVFLTSPFFSAFAIASDSYQRAEKTAESVEMAVQKVPSKITHGTAIMVKKIGLGILGAVQVCVIMVFLLVLAAVLGVGLVQIWVEEPVFVRERLFFDYTDADPEAIFPLAGAVGLVGKSKISKQIGVPIGHTYYVSLVLLMPESDFNREIGVFQLSAEILSMNGNVLAKSSQPCMLRFRSPPVRLARTFLMGVPLLLGITDETQKITHRILRHKEENERTGAIRVTLSPRAGTSFLPQLYEAEIFLNSQLPWTKKLVHNWKWTFYVWMSVYIYLMLLMILVCCCKPVLFPLTTVSFRDRGTERIEREVRSEKLKETVTWSSYGEEIPDSLRRWQLRRKRKAIYLHEVVPETTGSLAATSMKITREDTSSIVEEIGDSESVCLGR